MIRGKPEVKNDSHITRSREVNKGVLKKKNLVNKKLKFVMSSLAQLFKGQSHEPIREIFVLGLL